MLYPDNIDTKTGFGEVKAAITACCLSAMGRAHCENMQFRTDFKELTVLLGQAGEFKSILESDSPFPADDYFEIQSHAAQIRIEGRFLAEEDLFELLLGIRTVFRIISYFRERVDTLPLLNLLLSDARQEPALVRIIAAVIDDAGKLRSDASPLYAELSRKINSLERDARRKVEQEFRDAQRAGYSGDGSLTVRDGRLCIPILAEHKRRVRGFIHDESSSGQTVYVEPEEVFAINNLIRDLEFDKRREKMRILRQTADDLRVYYPLLLEYDRCLGFTDFIRAKALYAIAVEASLPKLHPGPGCRLVDARHPVLDLNLRRAGGRIVPLDFTLDATNRIILVSGPNAGGKSVCLKTLAILQLMIQHGILVSAHPDSSFGLYEDIFVDIGDDQSMESDLSTYSAHLTNMKLFVEKGHTGSLILIDEFGTGTDPVFGGPIAEAVLQVLNEHHVSGLITTHYSNLKIFASHEAGLINASMLFDNATMTPLYKLEIGKPGSSYAFEIAQKIGLPARIIELSKARIGDEQKRIDNLLVTLEREKTALIKEKAEAAKASRRLEFLTEENTKLKEFLDANRNRLIAEAKKEAQAILKNANRLVESTIHEIKLTNADKESTRELRRKLNDESGRLNISAQTDSPRVKDPDLQIFAGPGAFHPGDWVKLDDHDSPGQILSISKDNAVLALGDIRSVVKLSRLTKLDKKQEIKIARSGYLNKLTSDTLDFTPELDLRGFRGEEAIAELERFLDRALMLNVSSLKIIHGKGDGILRKMVREYLKKYGSSNRIEDEHPDRGGDAITYVYF